MNITTKRFIYICASIFLQASIYLYLDKVVLAPTSAFKVTAPAENAENVTGGKVYYSHDRQYMASIQNHSVEIFAMPGKKNVRTIDTSHKTVSYFQWLDDRDFALMGLQEDISKDSSQVVLTQINPTNQRHELSTTVKNLPQGSKIVDVAFSTATNVIYMQIKTAENPDLYRVYRTDANYELARIPLVDNKIGRIAVLYDEDTLFYDDLTDGSIIARFWDGSWRRISPYGAKYRLIGVDMKANEIYIVHLNSEGLGDVVYKGKLKKGFEQERVLKTPVDAKQIKLSDILQEKESKKQ